jgi:hypothetical protein
MTLKIIKQIIIINRSLKINEIRIIVKLSFNSKHYKNIKRFLNRNVLPYSCFIKIRNINLNIKYDWSMITIDLFFTWVIFFYFKICLDFHENSISVTRNPFTLSVLIFIWIDLIFICRLEINLVFYYWKVSSMKNIVFIIF